MVAQGSAQPVEREEYSSSRLQLRKNIQAFLQVAFGLRRIERMMQIIKRIEHPRLIFSVLWLQQALEKLIALFRRTFERLTDKLKLFFSLWIFDTLQFRCD